MAVDPGARCVPRREDRADRGSELLRADPAGSLAGRIAVELLERAGEPHEVAARELRVELDPALVLQRRECRLEDVRVDSGDHLAVHLDQPPVGVEREARLPVVLATVSATPRLRPRFRIVSIIPGIETGPPERTERSSGCRPSPKRLPVNCSSRARCSVDLVGEARGRAPVAHRAQARLGRDREAARHGQPELRHLGQAEPLAAEQRTPALARLVEVVGESSLSCGSVPMTGLLSCRWLAPAPLTERQATYW